MTPFLAIVVDALGLDDGLRWFEEARETRQRVLEDKRDDSYCFGCAHYGFVDL
ncbi:hypothetical protein [Streptomyces anulatus]|uniref:hypothetical protein n=1 Tax=Streptomyces anulatus TaxID=1892 RepID=UPI002F910D6B